LRSEGGTGSGTDRRTDDRAIATADRAADEDAGAAAEQRADDRVVGEGDVGAQDAEREDETDFE
jgi:hypothetical protein